MLRVARRWQGPVALLAVLLGLTAVGVILTADRVHDSREDELARRAREATSAIDQRMRDYGQVLRGAAALYESSDDVSPTEFRRFFTTQDVKRRYAGLGGILHATLISGAQAADFERRTRAQRSVPGLDYRRFAIRPRPVSSQQRLLVVDASTEANAAPFGVDLMMMPERRRPARIALQTGAPAASSPLRLIGSANTATLGLLLVAPIYDPATSAWAGVVYAAFRMDNLLRGALGAQAPGVRTEIYDLGPATTTPSDAPVGRHAVGFNLTGDDDRAHLGDADTRVQTLAVGDRRWAVAYTDPRTMVSGGERALPWIIAAAGLLVSILAAALMRAQLTARARAMRLARRMTAELRQREEELQRSNAELEHFAYLASHDLQEPLRTITSYVGLLESRAADTLDDRTRSWLRFISDGADRMSHLIADLLQYSRTGRSAGEREETSLSGAWDRAVENLHGAVAEAGATVTRDELPTVLGQPRELTSVLQNLLANGLKYRGDAAPGVHASARRQDGFWEISVADNGIGIDPRFHDRIFGLFQRLHTNDEYPGTGMGLAIVKKIAESNGGTIRVESTAGGGATFILSLPVPPDGEER